MKIFKHTYDGFFYQHWTVPIAVSYFLKGVSREFRIAPKAVFKWHQNIMINVFKRRFGKKTESGALYFDIQGAIFPDFSAEKDAFYAFAHTGFIDSFLISCYHNDNYDASLVDRLDKHMPEGPHCYRKGDFDVSVQKDDVVIDVGAWVGDFSAYASTKGAVCYAFEPSKTTFNVLCKTAELNKNIYPIQKGLSNSVGETSFFHDDIDGKNSICIAKNENTSIEKISITTLDKFVEEHKLEKVDFIKADIEGAERDLLKGAEQVLKKFAPKLSICTYHLPDDPEVLEKIILEINPDYKVIQLRNKLYAAVVKSGKK